MADGTTIEQRVAALEKEVSELRRRIPSDATPANWIERISGSMAEFPEFEEVIRLGQEIRQADRPNE